MSILDDFVPFNFDEGMPYMSVTCNGVTFNRSVTIKLGFPKYIKLLFDYDNKKLAIVSSAKGETSSILYYKNRHSSSVLSVKYNRLELLDTIEKMMGWDLKLNMYRINGAFIKEESAIIFDLTKAEVKR